MIDVNSGIVEVDVHGMTRRQAKIFIESNVLEEISAGLDELKNKENVENGQAE